MGQICFILGNRFLIIHSNFESAITQKLSELSGEDLQLRDQRSLTGIMALRFHDFHDYKIYLLYITIAFQKLCRLNAYQENNRNDSQ